MYRSASTFALALALSAGCGGASRPPLASEQSQADRVWREDVTCWAPLRVELACAPPCAVGLPPDTRCSGIVDMRRIREREIDERDASLLCGCLCPDDPPPDIPECQ